VSAYSLHCLINCTRKKRNNDNYTLFCL